ncbi:MAG: molybdopterin molybdotransferase MoeA [Robiginitomaculum sp.]|nr:molybdopterin molybdotransferase MoeA [Robiginitomaculum sp.]
MAKLISVETALKAIQQACKPMATTTLPLTQIDGHVLVKDALAKTTLPPLDASAMDGYAVKLETHHGLGSKFTLIGEAPAGAPYQGKVGPDQTVRIFTGGAVPDGANHVIMQENVEANGTTITLTEPISKVSHIRRSGIDFKKGQVIVKAKTHLDAYAIALLAAANHSEAEVYRRPKIALIANGDELVEPGQNMPSGAVVSSNPYGLAPLIKAWGGDVILAGISRDDPKAIKDQIASCADADILVPVGGASVGDHDYMRPVFTELGYTKIFEKVAVKPGKPVWFGKLNKQYVMGLPGNPASALVTAHVFLKPLIEALTNSNASNKTIFARTTEPIKAATWRAEYIRATAHVDDRGIVNVTPIPRQDSSLLTPFLTANCFLVRGPETHAADTGDLVKILPIKPLLRLKV